MILGVGVDIVQNSRFESWLNDEKKILRFFNEKEIDFSNVSAAKLASRFAAKEALVKAFGIGFRNVAPQSIAMLKNDLGQPYFYMEGEIKKICDDYNVRDIYVSISHEKEYSIAFVVIEGDF